MTSSSLYIANFEKKIAYVGTSNIASSNQNYDSILSIFLLNFSNVCAEKVPSEFTQSYLTQLFFMKTSYNSFVESVEDAITHESKAQIRTRELAKIRNRIKMDNDVGRPRIVSKLIYLEMEGENTNFGQVEIVSLMANPRFSYKWIGYIAASVLLDPNSDTLLLITQTVIHDIENQQNPDICYLALSTVANLGGKDLLIATLPSIQKCLESKNPRILKAAASASLRAIKDSPEYCNNFRPFIPKLLNSSDHAAILVGTNLALEMLKINSSLAQQWKKFTRPFIDLLRDLKNTPPSTEIEFHLFNDPFLQCQALRVLALIDSRSDELDSVLQEIITDLDYHSVTGRSILIQATETIKFVAKSQSLKTLAINQIGRMLDLRKDAIIYSALSAFSRLLLTSDSKSSFLVDRNSTDSTAMQRYRSQIVKYLDHPDWSIRRRALDVIMAIINQQNATNLIPEIIRYIKQIDNHYKGEIVPKLYSAIQRFSPNETFYMDSALDIILGNPEFIGNGIITSFCALLNDNIELRTVALTSLENVFEFYADNQPLIQIAAFCIGEYEQRHENISNLIQSFINVLKAPNQLGRTMCYVISCLTKLAIRFNKVNEVIAVIEQLSHNNKLDVQQRAGEMYRMLSSPSKFIEVLRPMTDEIENHVPLDDSNENSLIDLMTTSNYVWSSDQLLSEPVNHELFSPPKNSQLAFERPEFVAYFEIRKNQENLNEIAIRVNFFSKISLQLTNFKATFAVPNGWTITHQQPSANCLMPAGGQPITQVLFLMNHGKAPLAMKAQISYMFRSQPVTENCQVGNVF